MNKIYTHIILQCTNCSVKYQVSTLRYLSKVKAKTKKMQKTLS